MFHVDEPWGPSSFTGSAEPYRGSCGHEERRDRAESSAAQHTVRGDSVTASGAAKLINNRPGPSAPVSVPSALPTHISVQDSTDLTGIDANTEYGELCRKTTSNATASCGKLYMTINI